MKIQQLQYLDKAWKIHLHPEDFDRMQCQLVLVFGEPSLITDTSVFNYLERSYPEAHIILSSTSGEIIRNDVYDNSVVVTAIQFDNTIVHCAETNIKRHKSSYDAGLYLMQQLQRNDLNAAFIISDGTNINGSELVVGFNETNKNNVPVTGGLAGDGSRFIKTFVGLNQLPAEGVIVAIGFYGQQLQVGHGSFGGWDEFGPARTITRSEKNILYEIDGKNAFDLYKEYLGPYKKELPGSTLLFPLSVKEPGAEKAVIRTILTINEKDRFMVFAGNMPNGSQVRLMKASYNKLIDGSTRAALHTVHTQVTKPDLAILISCIGRKLILRERTEEEVQAVNEIFGKATCTTGFYSYGEISPFHAGSQSELHNQTMTITTFTEF
ncbi:histidine kinase [Niastella caeni]|uniref:Histidine kinase n=1 Tax=Niastella caeni TaxID=2569763 RepID=A0A4V4H1Q4_9BACT|nr:FIST N-terminal domain-containing protein [Niastella caeni]THU41346.1 histidine kinase [Niastella caeni]